VRAVCAFYGPADFLTFPRDNAEVPALLGGPIDECRDLARAASPITYVSAASPAHLLAHGDADEIVPIEQSCRFRDALTAAGVEVTLHVLPGVGHSGDVLYNDPTVKRMVGEFFERHLM
jgi:dipeptidyl aminopeptidase/acylaminoacyl peptidase